MKIGDTLTKILPLGKLFLGEILTISTSNTD
jgi:hypothetical protein